MYPTFAFRLHPSGGVTLERTQSVGRIRPLESAPSEAPVKRPRSVESTRPPPGDTSTGVDLRVDRPPSDISLRPHPRGGEPIHRLRVLTTAFALALSAVQPRSVCANYSRAILFKHPRSLRREHA